MKTRVHSRVHRSLVVGCTIAVLSLQGVQFAMSADWRKVNNDVSEQIAMLQPPIGPHNIDIDNRGRGEVRLEGYVESEEARRRVQEAAERAHGVSKVDNRLAIATAPRTRRNEEIVRMEEAFRRDVPNARYNVSVFTESDRVILRGTVDSQGTREKIVSSAASVAKRTVSDQLVVKGVPSGSPLSDAEIEQSIRRALSKEYPRLIKELQVTVRNGEATVEGKLSNHRQVDEVLATILDVEGVENVRSQITINGRPYTGGAAEPAPE
jgi:osmotically-inducible protein OsmY